MNYIRKDFSQHECVTNKLPPRKTLKHSGSQLEPPHSPKKTQMELKELIMALSVHDKCLKTVFKAREPVL